MKLFLMKLCSLLVVVLGVLLMAWALRIGPVTEALWTYYTQFMDNEVVRPVAVQVLIAAALLVFGLLAFLPGRNPRSLRRAVIIPSEHGQVAVQLDALRPVLLKVLRRMPEVRKVQVSVKPPRGKKKAIVTAFVSLRQQATMDLRQHVDIITQHIAETAVKLLGIENLVDVEVIVDGMKVDAKAAAAAVMASKDDLQTRLLTQATPVVPGVLGYDAPPSPAEDLEDEYEPDDDSNAMEPENGKDAGSEPVEAVSEPEVAEPVSASIVAYDDSSDPEDSAESLASGDDFVPAFVESENAPPLPPIDPESLVTPTDATINSFDSDAEYALPPMSEQEEALVSDTGEDDALALDAVEADEESDPFASSISEEEEVVEEVVALAEHGGDAHEPVEESVDPLGEALREDDEVTTFPDPSYGDASADAEDTVSLDAMTADDLESPVTAAELSLQEEPVESIEKPVESDGPASPQRKPWSFF